jgi:uncharacterized protein (DUF924 family)
MPDPTAEELEQLARSVAMSTSLGEADRLAVIEALRELAAAKARHPARGRVEGRTTTD